MKSYWEEFVVEVPWNGRKTHLCGLCGNTGRLPAMTTHSPAGTLVCLPKGKPCICPNGRAIKRRERSAMKLLPAEQRMTRGVRLWEESR